MADDDALVSTGWLAAHLDHPQLRLIDASFKMPGATPHPREDFLGAHIPGAVFFDVDAIADHAGSLPHMFPSSTQFACDVAALGVGSDHDVVVYDSGSWMAAPRVWWMFRTFGHANVRVLDGGLKKWRAEGRPLASGAPAPSRPAQFEARFDPQRLRAKAELIANLAARREQVVDARARERFEGAVVEPWPGRRSGRIPGSYNVPFGTLLDAQTGAMKGLDDIRAAFETAGVDLARPIVTSCGSGVSAAVLTLALFRLGVRESALYDGSWAEWGLPDGPEVEVGPRAG